MPQAARARILGSFAAGIALAAPCAAGADEPANPGPLIRWSAPPECPGVEPLREQVARLLKKRPTPSRAVAAVTGEVTRDESAIKPYRVRLVLTDPQGGTRERRIEGETCAQVADAAAVVVALASDADEADNPVPAGPTPIAPPVSAEPPSPSATAASLRSDVPAASQTRVWEIGVLGGVDAASLPGPAPGVGLVGAVGIGPNHLELQATAWLPRRATLTSYPSVSGDFALFAGALRYCRGLFAGVLDLAPCAGLEAGAFVGMSRGLTTHGVSLGPWIAPEFGLMGIVRPSSRVSVSLEVDGLVAPVRPQFIVTSSPSGRTLGQVFQPQPGSGRVLLALRVRLP